MAAQRLSNLHRSKEELIRESLRFQLDQSGADPSGFFEALETAIELRAWEGLGMPGLAAFIVEPYPDGIGSTIENVQALLTLTHRYEHQDPRIHARMTRLRTTVMDALTPAIGEHGGDRTEQGSNTTLKSIGTRDQIYTVGRLKRDKQTDLADQVLRGEISANAAAIRAGYRKPYTSVRTDDPDKVAVFLTNYFNRDDIKKIYDLALFLLEGRD